MPEAEISRTFIVTSLARGAMNDDSILDAIRVASRLAV